MNRTTTRIGAFIAAAALAVAACGSSADTDSNASSSATQAGATEPDAAEAPTDPSGSDVPSASADVTGTVRLSEAGGQSGESIQVAYIDTLDADITVELTPQLDLGAMIAANEAGSETNDIIELDSVSAVAALALGLTTELDYDAIDPIDPLDELAQQPYGLGHQYYSTIAAWSAGTNPISGFSDFFDPTAAPGVRAVPDIPIYPLHLALIADGVSPDELYPLDVDRAFEVMDRIADDVVLWASGAETEQLLETGEVDYAMAWSGRIVDNDEIEFTFEQGLLDLAYLVVPAGSQNTEATNVVLRQFTSVENQLAALEVIPYTAGGAELPDLVPDEIADQVPTSPANAEVQSTLDPTWWAENFEEVAVRWEEWKAKL